MVRNSLMILIGIMAGVFWLFTANMEAYSPQDFEIYLDSSEILPSWDMVELEYLSEQELLQYIQQHNNISIARILKQRIDTERDQIRLTYYFFDTADQLKNFQQYIFSNWQNYHPIYTIHTTLIEVETQNNIDRQRVLDRLNIPFFDQIKLDFETIPAGYEFTSETLSDEAELQELSQKYQIKIEKHRELRLNNGGEVILIINYYQVESEARARELMETLIQSSANNEDDYQIIKNIVIEIKNRPAFTSIIEELDENN